MLLLRIAGAEEGKARTRLFSYRCQIDAPILNDGCVLIKYSPHNFYSWPPQGPQTSTTEPSCAPLTAHGLRNEISSRTAEGEERSEKKGEEEDAEMFVDERGISSQQ